MIIRSIDVFSAGKVAGGLYALLGLIFGGLFSLFAMAGLAIGGPGANQGLIALVFGAGAIVILPLFYGAIGFIGGSITALLYNAVAAIAGGIEFEVDATDEAI